MTHQMIRITLHLFLSTLLQNLGLAQVSGGINFNDRRVRPPRILPAETQQQQQPQQPQRQTTSRGSARPSFNPYAQSSTYYGAAYMSERLTRLEADMGQFSRALNAIPSSVRMTVNAYVTEAINRVNDDLQSSTTKIDENKEKVDTVSQELKYIKNSNANMQKRMDKIEAAQKSQQELIENIQRSVEAMQQFQLAGASNAKGDEGIFVISNAAGDSRLDELASNVASLATQLNNTDTILENYDESIRSFAENILILNDKTNQLERESVTNTNWISSNRAEIRALQDHIDEIQAFENDYEENVTDDLQSEIGQLNKTLQAVTLSQKIQLQMLNNLTSNTRSMLANGTDDVNIDYENEPSINGNADVFFQLASSVATLEEAVRDMQETQAITDEETNRKIRILTGGLSANAQAVNDIEGKLYLENQNMESRLEILNQTMLIQSETLQQLPNLNSKITDILPATEENYFLSDDVVDEEVDFENGNIDYVTIDFLKKQLEIFRTNLSSLQEVSSSNDTTKNFQNQIPLEQTLIQSSSANLIGSVDINAFNLLQTNLDVLNTSVAVHGSMIQQAIRAMGEYDRRLRQVELQDRSKTEEFQEIRRLFVNATESLSLMSLTIAQNQLSISNMEENSRVGDDMLLDLADQIFENEKAISTLNQNYSNLAEATNSDEALALNFPVSLSEANNPENVHQINRQGTEQKVYVTQTEFGGLADALAQIAGQVEYVNQKQDSLESVIDDLKTNSSLHLSREKYSNDLNDVWFAINSSSNLMEFLQNVIASVSNTNAKIERDMNSLTRSVGLLQNNDSKMVNSGLYGDEFIHLLDTSVRDLRMEVGEQRIWLGNQRRRIRQIEDEYLLTCAKITDVAAMNDTIRRRLNTVDTSIQTLTTDLLTRETNLRAAAIENFNSTDISIVQKLEEDVAYLMNRANDETGPRQNVTIRSRFALDDEFRTVPLTLRILEGQVQEFQDALQTLARLEVKVDTLRNVQSSVLKNSRDITTFHESVQNVEKELDSIKRKTSLLEFSNQRFISYQNDLRSRINNTKFALERTSDETAIQGQKLRYLSRYLEGNVTQLRGRITANELSLDDQDQRLSSVKTLADDLEQEIRQQSAAELIRHNDLDSRISRDEQRIQHLEDTSTQNSDSLVTLSRSVSEEANSRQSAIQLLGNEVSSVRTALSSTESQTSNLRQTLSQYNQEMAEFGGTQVRHSGDILNLQTSLRELSESFQTNSKMVQKTENEQNTMKNEINNAVSDIATLRESVTTQVNTLLSMRQNNVVLNDEISTLQQNSQSNTAFVRHAEQALDRLNADIAYILAHSSNHSVAIETLKHKIADTPEDSENTTHELMSEIQLVKYDLRGVSNEFNTFKRQTSVRNSASLLLEERLTEMASSAAEYDNKARSNRDILDRLRNDVRRYGDRVRTLETTVQEHAIARSDLQQVVVSNRNELSVVSELQSTLNRFRLDVANTATRQDNKSTIIHQNVEATKLRLTRVSNQLAEHDTLLRTLRQERISAEANVDQIFRSSNNLEQLLRAAVTDLNQLKRDFEENAATRGAIPRLQNTVRNIENDFQRAKQTVKSNENKLERMQDLIDRTLTSVNGLVTTTQNLLDDEQSRDLSRTNELRDLRENLGRSSVQLRTLQNELRQQNERIQLLNQRVIDVDNRVSISISQIAFTRPENTNRETDSSLNFEASGWLLSPTSQNDSNEDSVEIQNVNVANTILQLKTVFNHVLQRVDNLSTFMFSTIENMDQQLAALQNQLIQDLDTSEKEMKNSNFNLSNSQLETLEESIILELRSRAHAFFSNQNDTETDAKLQNITRILMALQTEVVNLKNDTINYQQVEMPSYSSKSLLFHLLNNLADIMESADNTSQANIDNQLPIITSTYSDVQLTETNKRSNASLHENSSDTISYEEYYSPNSEYENQGSEQSENSFGHSESRNGFSVVSVLRNMAAVVSLTKNNMKKNLGASLLNDSHLEEILHRLESLEDNFKQSKNTTSSSDKTFQAMFSRNHTIEKNSPTKSIDEEEIVKLVNLELMKRPEFRLIRENVSLILEALSQYQISNQQQQHHQLHLLFQQNANIEKLNLLENATETLQIEFDLIKMHLDQLQNYLEEKQLVRLDETRKQILDELTQYTDILYDVINDVTILNLTVNRDKRMFQDFNTTLINKLPMLEAVVAQHEDSIIEVQKKQDAQKEKSGETDLTISLLFEHVDSLSSDFNTLNQEVTQINNETRSMVYQEQARSLEKSTESEQDSSLGARNFPNLKKLILQPGFQVCQLETEQKLLEQLPKLDAVNEKYQKLLRNITSLLQAQHVIDLKFGFLNQSKTDVNVDLSNMQEELETLVLGQGDLELSMTRHSMELRGLASTMRAMEDLIQTLSDTVNQQGSRMSLVSGTGVPQSSDFVDFDILTRLVLNHTSSIENLENQMTILQTRIRNQPSVRIIVPPRGGFKNQNIKQSTTTTASTTTSTASSEIPPPTSVSVTSLKFDEFDVSWIRPINPLISGYRVVVESTDDPNDMLQISAVQPPVTIVGLNPSTRYLISVHTVINQRLSLPASVIAETDSPPAPPTTTTTTSSTTLLATPTSPKTPDPNSIYSDLVIESKLQGSIDAVEVFSCNFDNSSICGFTNDLNDDFDWTHWNGSTPSSDTGPSNDHTTNSNLGFYMFIEASRPRLFGHIARLLSAVMPATTGQCLHFYYHMFGLGTGDLNVVKLSADWSTSTAIWSESGDRGDQWKMGIVSITSDAPFRIAFEAVRGSDYHADTAIDDISIQEGACPEAILECGFESSDLCGFLQDYDDDFDWQRNNGATSSAETGPTADHTLGTSAGYYLYLEASNPRISNDTTRLSSPLLHPTSGQCLEFYYHMHGVDIATLNVYMRSQRNFRGLGTPIWSKTGPQGNEWLLGHAALVSSDSFQIVLEGLRGDDYHGDIAIDDVKISDGSCVQPSCTVGAKFKNFCYEVQNEAKSYQDATDTCIRNGGLLAAVKTMEQQTFIAENLLNNEADKWRLFWIGVSDREIEGLFTFSDNTFLESGFWNVGKPNDRTGDEDCVRMEYATDGRRWNDAQCSVHLAFICQYPIGT